MPHSPAHRPGARRALGCALSLTLGLAAATALLLLAGRPALAAPLANVITVTPGQSIQAAIDGANAGDTIVIQAGTYTQSLTLSSAVSLTGVSSATVILRPIAGQRVLTVTGAAINASVVISGFSLRGADISSGSDCPANCGGGLYIAASAQPLLRNLIFQDNVAWQGGGLYAEESAAMSGVLFSNNNTLDSGGALFAPQSVTLTDTRFISNSAAGLGAGGGAYSFHVTASGGLFERNACSGATCEGGGLVTQFLVLSGTRLVSNTAVVQGGGAAALFGASVQGGSFEGNRCTQTGCHGGGLYARFGLGLTGTQFISNTSLLNGGGVDAPLGDVTASGARFERNACTQTGCNGGGFSVDASAANFAVLSNTDFVSNTANQDGGGLFAGAVLTMQAGSFQGNHCTLSGCAGGGLYAGYGANLTGVQFSGNSSHSGGGGAYFAQGGALAGSLFQNNSCANSGCQGGGAWANDSLTVTATLFLANTSAGPGGGLAQDTAGSLRVVNALFARNTAGQPGQALWFGAPGSATILHTTIATPTLAAGAAIVVANGSLGVSNTLVTSYSVGISLTSGSAYEDHNLFFGVATPASSGVVSGSHHPTGDPRFENPAQDDYHLLGGGPAVDAGPNVGVNIDFEGDPRPTGGGFDLGFDEFVNHARYLFLPLVRR